LHKFVKHAGVKLVSELIAEHLTRWLGDTRSVERLGDKSVSDRFQIARKWLAWMADPKPLKPKKAAKRKIDYFTAKEYRLIFEQAAREKNPRALPMAALALYGGYRAEEIFVMEYEEIRFGERVIEVGQGEKTTKTRNARVTPILDQALKYLLPLRSGKGRIFSGWKNKQAFGAYFMRMVERAIGRSNPGSLV